MAAKEHFVVGLGGPKRSGKNTLADMLDKVISEQGYLTAQLALADPLRDALLATNPLVAGLTEGGTMDRDLPLMRLEHALEAFGGWEGIKATPYGLEVRLLLQRLGTEGIRSLDDAFWLKAMRAKIENLPSGTVAFITDVRFPNEAELMSSMGTLLCLDRPSVKTDDGHASEQDLSPLAHRVIINDGTLEDLRAQAEPLARELMANDFRLEVQERPFCRQLTLKI